MESMNELMLTRKAMLAKVAELDERIGAVLAEQRRELDAIERSISPPGFKATDEQRETYRQEEFRRRERETYQQEAFRRRERATDESPRATKD